MDLASGSREKLLTCKSKEQKVRVHLRNQFESRQLQDKLGFLTTRYDRKEYLLNRRIQQVREDMWRSEMLAMTDIDTGSDEDGDETDSTPESITELLSQRAGRVATPVTLPKYRIKSAPNFFLDIHGQDRTRIASGTVRWRKKPPKKLPECRFGSGGHVCSCFPCIPPKSYTNIGFDVKPHEEETRKKFIVSTYTSTEDRERLLIDVEASSVRRPLQTSRDQTVQKERSLRKIIAEMKVRRERDQPKDWCINYGKPTPKRKLYTAARPPPSSEFPI